jgi:hypothetical protein
MKWTQHYRSDKGVMEYLCSHGVGHELGIHGCDGCCGDKSFPLLPSSQSAQYEKAYQDVAKRFSLRESVHDEEICKRLEGLKLPVRKQPLGQESVGLMWDRGYCQAISDAISLIKGK